MNFEALLVPTMVHMIPLLALAALRLHPMALMGAKWLTLLAPISQIRYLNSEPRLITDGRAIQPHNNGPYGKFLCVNLVAGKPIAYTPHHFGRLSQEPGMGASMTRIN